MNSDLFKPVFILGPGNCGFELFVSLLDNHEEVVVMPYSFKFYALCNLHKLDKEKNIENLKNIILNKSKLERFKSGCHKVENPFFTKKNVFQDLSKFNINIFEKNFEIYFEKNPVNRKNILIAIYTSYALAIGKDLKKIKIFFIDNMYRDNTNEIIEDFHDAKFLYLMRDPRETFLSQCQYYFNKNYTMTPIKNNKNLYQQVLKNSLSENYNMLTKLKSNSSINLEIVKFENIHRAKEKIMKNISNKYNLKFNKCLLETTVFGKKSSSISSFSTKAVTGVNVNRLLRYKKKLSTLNIILLEKIFFNTIKDNNYELSYKQNNLINFLFFLSYLFPMKNELLPSSLIFKAKYKKKFKNNIFFRSSKYSVFFLGNIFFYFINRLFSNYKIYSIRN